MLFEDSDGERIGALAKKTRIERACDVCRRRKIRCKFKGRQNACDHCVQFELECTYMAPKRRRGPSNGYVHALETRLAKLESVLKQLVPETDLIEHAGPSLGSSDAVRLEDTPQMTTRIGVPPLPIPAIDEDNSYSSSDSDDVAVLELHGVAKWMQRMQFGAGPGGYQGRSSHVRLVRDAFELRNQSLGENATVSGTIDTVLTHRRPEVWKTYPWEIPRTPDQRNVVVGTGLEFPEPDLLDHLVDNYFRDNNAIFPLLNEILFKGQLADGLHLVDQGFSAIVLLVAALGTRGSEDPRIFVDPSQPHSRGWKWFNQVQRLQRPLVAPATLYDIQIIMLTVAFLHGSSAPSSGWSLVGTGIRLAMDVGAHRRQSYGNKPTVHSEQWKRAFWILICLDRHISNNVGRSCSLHDEDFDLDLPADCDDEYWFVSDPSLAFKQPPNKPSKISHFIHLIKYFRILSFVLRTLYTINKSNVLTRLVGPSWEEDVIVQCDSALNKWKESIPEHLIWDPHRENDNDFHISAMMQICYYHLQVTIHRPFIPLPHKKSPISFPSLEICTNAARAISTILDLQYPRLRAPFPWQIMPAFVAGIALLLHVWGNKQKGMTADLRQEMEGVYICMRVLKLCEKAWHIAGQYWDTLYVLASSNNLPLPDDFERNIVEHQANARSNTPKFTSTNPTDDLMPQGMVSLFSSQTGQENIGVKPSDFLNTMYPYATTTLSSSGDIAANSRSSLSESNLSVDIWPAHSQDTLSVDLPLEMASPFRSATQWCAYALPPGNSTSNHNYIPQWNYADIMTSNTGVNLPDMYDVTTLWSAVPRGFELADWNSYIREMTSPISQNDGLVHQAQPQFT